MVAIGNDGGRQMGELRFQRSRDVALAGGADGVQAGAALFTAQRVKVGNFCGIAQVVAEHRDVNVFGKPRDQAERLGQRGAALEQ